MTTTNDKLKKLVLERYGSMTKFAEVIGINYQSLMSIFRRGIENTTITNVLKICKGLGISADALGQGIIAPINAKQRNDYVFTDLNDLLEFYNMNIDKLQEMTLDGEPLTAEDVVSILDSADFTVELIRRRRKRKK